TVFRVVQEALNNIANYAQANHVAIQLKRVPDADARADVLLLSITDDGVGFDMEKKSSGTGILGMRERVIATGGEFDLSSMPGQGVRIHIKLPAYIEPDEDYEQW
ncbi:MAG: ATP-binding protein, partial [Gallionellaceae bacterium]|nr:ATP-binding protein [Gallionellaceae bacterium]